MSVQVPKGYQQTEVGVIPEDWQALSLGIIGNFKNGINKDSSEFGYGHPFVNLMDVFGKNRITSHEKLGLINTNSIEHKFYDLRLGDVIFIRSSVKPSGVGLTAVVESTLEKTVFSGFLIRFRDMGYIDNKFKRHCFYDEGFRRRIVAASSVSANTNINQDSLKNIYIGLPTSKVEQQAIAEALSDADALIESLEQLIAKKRQIKQGAMQELLTGQRRLPGFSGEWKRKKLGDICDIRMGRTPSRLNPHYWGAGHKWLSISDLKEKYIFESNEEITSLAACEMQVIPKGSLLMSFKLSLGRLAFAGCDLYTNEAICSFQGLNANAQFLYYILGRTDFSLYGKQAVKGYTLNKESLKTIEILMPPLDEQNAIAEVLSIIDCEIDELDLRLNKARQIKQSMMQELLTGHIRLL